MTPEFIAIIALGLTLIGLLLTFRRDARADTQALRADTQALRADNRALRAEVRAEIQNFRGQVQAEHHALRAEVHAGIERLRQDVQALAERTARLEGAIQGLTPTRDDPARHTDAARPTP